MRVGEDAAERDRADKRDAVVSANALKVDGLFRRRETEVGDDGEGLVGRTGEHPVASRADELGKLELPAIEGAAKLETGMSATWKVGAVTESERRTMR